MRAGTVTRRDIADLLRRYFQIIEIAEERHADRGFWHVLMERRAGVG